MALAAAEFLKRVAGRNFAPGYLLAGSELYLRDKARDALVECFLEGDRGGWISRDLAEVPVRDALDDAASLGLFAARRVLWLRNAESLLPRRRSAAAEENAEEAESQTAGRHYPEAITAYFQRPQPASIVVFEATSLDLGDRDDLRRAERLEKLLPVVSVRLDRPPLAGAARCLVEEARRGGFALARDVAAELAEACAGDLARATRELEKLMLYAAGRGRITSQDIEALVPAESSFTLWEISDAIGDRNVRRALELLHLMLRQQTSALLLLALIASQVRKLLKCKEGSGERVHPRVREQARKFTARELAEAIQKIFEAEVALRSSPPDERVVLERLIIDLAQKK